MYILDFVIFCVRSNEADVNRVGCEEYNHYQSVVIALYVEHIAVVPHLRHRGESASDVGEIVPVSLFRLFVPFIKRLHRLWVIHNKLIYRLF